ncbi:LamG-like jellyroll fold domain-containing protein [Patescibacteria group bacterium]
MSDHDQRKSAIAAVTGYQWHVLNKSENWITRGVRTEYAGSYVIERPGREILGLLKQIHGTVYMIKRNVLEQVGWGTSITEDFQLTLKLYEQGYKIVYTPYVQAPAECVSTLKRLIRQRMRWAEGHSNNIRKMAFRLLFGKWVRVTKPVSVRSLGYVDKQNVTVTASRNGPPNRNLNQHKDKVFIPSPLSFMEKLEVFYLAPYYLQAFFFIIGTMSWLISETVFQVKLPFWTELWGWSLVLTNLFSLPLMNAVGMFLEEAEEKDYLGIVSFMLLCYILVPFQAYAAVKGLLKKEEGPWFRTPKTGKVTDVFTRGQFYRWVSGIIPGRFAPVTQMKANISLLRGGREDDLLGGGKSAYLSLASANNRFQSFKIKPKRKHWRGFTALILIMLTISSSTLFMFLPTISSKTVPQALAQGKIGISADNTDRNTDDADKELMNADDQDEKTDNSRQKTELEDGREKTETNSSFGSQTPIAQTPGVENSLTPGVENIPGEDSSGTSPTPGEDSSNTGPTPGVSSPITLTDNRQKGPSVVPAEAGTYTNNDQAIDIDSHLQGNDSSESRIQNTGDGRSSLDGGQERLLRAEPEPISSIIPSRLSFQKIDPQTQAPLLEFAWDPLHSSKKKTASPFPVPSIFPSPTLDEADVYALQSFEGSIMEIGTQKHSPPKPYLKLEKWDQEVFLKLDIPVNTQENPKKIGETLKYSSADGQADVLFYPRRPKEIIEKDPQGGDHKFHINEQGGVEFDTIFYRKPKTNQLIFPFESKGLAFHYQLPLNQEERDPGLSCSETSCQDIQGQIVKFRPEQVVGSYAVYHESKSGDYTQIGGKNYRTGKAFHIYRPKVADAQGNEIWGELSINDSQSLLTLTIDQDWLDQAVYPVTVDPNFGYETVGGSSGNAGDTQIYTSAKSTPINSGKVTSLRIYGYNGGAGNTDVTVGLYTDSSGPASKVGSEKETIDMAQNTTPRWMEFSTNAWQVTSGNSYWLAGNSDQDLEIYFDSPAGTNRYWDDSFTYGTAWPSTFSKDSNSSAQYSMYCVYDSNNDDGMFVAVGAEMITVQSPDFDNSGSTGFKLVFDSTKGGVIDEFYHDNVGSGSSNIVSANSTYDALFDVEYGSSYLSGDTTGSLTLIEASESRVIVQAQGNVTTNDIATHTYTIYSDGQIYLNLSLEIHDGERNGEDDMFYLIQDYNGYQATYSSVDDTSKAAALLPDSDGWDSALIPVDSGDVGTVDAAQSSGSDYIMVKYDSATTGYDDETTAISNWLIDLSETTYDATLLTSKRNDYRNPDVLTYTTGSEWDDVGTGPPNSAPAAASPGLETDSVVESNVLVGDINDSLDMTDAMSIEAWVKVESGFGNWRTIAAKRTSLYEYWFGFNTQNNISLCINPDDEDPEVDSDRWYVDGDSAITDSNWHHVAATYDGVDVRIYLDGVLDDTPEAKTDTIYSGSGNFRIALNGNIAGIDAVIDEVRVWSDGRTAAEIADNMNKQIDPSSANLEGYWRFNENTGTTTYDETTNNNDGTLTDGPVWQTGFVPDQYNEAEGGYTVDAANYAANSQASRVDLDIDGNTYTRHNPSFKIRKWRDTRLPTAVTLEGETLYPGTSANSDENYNASLKPFSEAYYSGTVNELIAVGTEDCEEADDNSGYDSSGNEVVAGGLDNDGSSNWVGGWRFTGVNVPQGVTIDSAAFDVRAGDYGGDYYVEEARIFADDVDDSASWSSSDSPHDRWELSQTTTAYQDWGAGDTETVADGKWFSATTNWQPPAITNVVQEVINRNGWVSGNDLSIIITPRSTGTDGWYFETSTYDRGSEYAAKLDIDYYDQIADGGDTGSADESIGEAGNDYTLTDFATTDYLYLGSDSKFTGVNYHLGTIGVGGVITWEYWDGDSWEDLANVTDEIDGSDDLLVTNGSFYFDEPYDWVAKTLTSGSESITGERELYWVRADVTTAFSTDPVLDRMWTDILLFQYYGDITAASQTLIISSGPVQVSQGSIQIDVPNRYRAIMETGDSTDYLQFWDRAEDDTTPNPTHEFIGPYINEGGTEYHLRYDANRITTILESNSLRVRIRVEGCFDTTGGGACLTDGTDKLLVTEEYTFTTEGMFVSSVTDFRSTGLALDNSDLEDGYNWLMLEADVTDGAYDDTGNILYGDGATESTTTVDGVALDYDNKYVVLPGNGSDTYQDGLLGIQRAGWFGNGAITPVTTSISQETIENDNDDGFVQDESPYDSDSGEDTWYSSGYINHDEWGAGDWGGPEEYHSGLRFITVPIPQGVTITSSEIQVYAESYGGTLSDIHNKIYGDDVDDAPVWSGSDMAHEITETTAAVDFDPSSWGSGSWETLPSVSSIVQEITSRVGWSSSNDIRFGLHDDGSVDCGASCDICLYFEDYSDATSNEALFNATYRTKNWYWDENDTGTLDRLYAREIETQPTGKHYADWFFLMLAEDDLDTEAEREAYINDYRNPDVLTYTTGSEWDEMSSLSGGEAAGSYAPAAASPGLEFERNSSQYVSVADDTDLDISSSFTIEHWVNWESIPSDESFLFTKGDDSVNNYYTDYSNWGNGDDELICGFYDGVAYEARLTSFVPNTDQWYHIACIFNDADNDIKLYLDGNLVDTESDVTDTPTDATNDGDLRLGRERHTYGYYLDGKMDEVRLWDDPRTQAEIQDNMYKQIDSASSNLVGYWRLDENTGTTAYDETTNNNDGTLTNSPTWTTGFVPDQYNEAEGFYTVDASGSQIEVDIDGGSNASTLADGAISAGDTTVTVDATTNFDSSGTAYIEGDRFTYTSLTTCSGDPCFSGVPSSGEDSVVGHVDNSIVSAGSRHQPNFKVRQYRDNNKPSLVTMEGTALSEGTDYNTAYKPITSSYFADELTWASTLESGTAITSPDIGDGSGASASTATFVSGKYGLGMTVDANTEAPFFVSSGNVDGDDGVVEFWYQNTVAPVASGVFFACDDGAGNIDMQLARGGNDTDIDFIVDDGAARTNSWDAVSVSLYDGEWHHVRLVYDADTDTPELYLDGVEQTRDATTAWTAITPNTNTYLGNTSQQDAQIGGTIDEIKFYSGNAAIDTLAKGGDTSDSDEYLFDEDSDYTLDFDADDANNRGEYVFLGSDSMFSGVNVDLATDGVDNGSEIDSNFEGADSDLCGGGDNWDTGNCEGSDTIVGNETGTVYDGTYSARATLVSDGSNDTAVVMENLSSSQGTIYSRFHFNLDYEGLGSNDKILLFACQDTTVYKTSSIKLREDGSGNLELGVDTSDETETWAGSDGYIQLDTWYMLETKMYRHASSGTMDLWLNGENILSVTGYDTGDNDYGRCYIGLEYQTTANQIYYDNVVIRDGTMEYDWEYWDGSAWQNLTITGTYGMRTEAFLDDGTFWWDDPPTNWRPYSVNGSTDLYWIRGHLDAGTYSTDPAENLIRTDIIYIQYLSNVTSSDQTIVVVPEQLWLFLAFVPIIPGLSKRRKKKGKKHKLL